MLDHFVRPLVSWCASFCWLLSFFVPRSFFLWVLLSHQSIAPYYFIHVIYVYTNSNICGKCGHSSIAHIWNHFSTQHTLGCMHTFIVVFIVLRFIHMCVYSDSIDRYLIVYEVMRPIFTQYVWFLILDYSSIEIIIYSICEWVWMAGMLTCIGHSHYIARRNRFKWNLFFCCRPIQLISVEYRQMTQKKP